MYDEKYVYLDACVKMRKCEARDNAEVKRTRENKMLNFLGLTIRLFTK